MEDDMGVRWLVGDTNHRRAVVASRVAGAVACVLVLVIIGMLIVRSAQGQKFGDLLSYGITNTQLVSERDLLDESVPLWSVGPGQGLTYTGRRSYIGAPALYGSCIDAPSGAPLCATSCSARNNVEYVEGTPSDDGVPDRWVLPSTPMQTWNTRPRPLARDQWRYLAPPGREDVYGLRQTAMRGGRAVDLPALGGATPDTQDIYALTEPDHDPLVN